MAVKKKYTSLPTRGNALGKGLDALISTEGVSTAGSSTISEIPIAQIEANPNQPRRDFDQVALQELANSISEIGIIQPITVAEQSANRYLIIAGERRWRASQLAGLTTLPAYVKKADDALIMEMALVENIQREDLNAIEVALAYKQLMEKEGATQEKVAQRVGKSRAAVANMLRLLRLPAQVQVALQKRQIDMGHARALLSISSPSQQVKIFQEIIRHSYSVRQVEELVSKSIAEQNTTTTPNKTKTTRQSAQLIGDLSEAVAQSLGAKVKITRNAKGRGKIAIAYDSEEQLNAIINKLK